MGENNVNVELRGSRKGKRATEEPGMVKLYEAVVREQVQTGWIMAGKKDRLAHGMGEHAQR